MIIRADTPEPIADGVPQGAGSGAGPGRASGGALGNAQRSGSGNPEMFFAALQMSRMPMCLSDPQRADNPIVFCNHAFEQLTGHAQHEIVGRNCRFLQGAETDRVVVADIRHSLEAGQDVRQELLNYRKDGSAFWNALFISPALDSGGTVVYHFASQLDVTDSREAAAVLQQARRMELLGAMATGLAHQFNDLVTIVLANIERAAIDTDPDRRAERLDRAGRTAERAARLTDQVLTFSRRRPCEPGIVDVNGMLAGCDVILERMAGDGVALVLEPCPGALPARLDPGQLELALLELVRSAAEASTPGGTIRVGTRRCLDGAANGVEVTVHGPGGFMPTRRRAGPRGRCWRTASRHAAPASACRWSGASWMNAAA